MFFLLQDNDEIIYNFKQSLITQRFRIKSILRVSFTKKKSFIYQNYSVNSPLYLFTFLFPKWTPWQRIERKLSGENLNNIYKMDI